MGMMGAAQGIGDALWAMAILWTVAMLTVGAGFGFLLTVIF